MTFWDTAFKKTLKFQNFMLTYDFEIALFLLVEV